MDYSKIDALVRAHFDRKMFLMGLGVAIGLYVVIFTAVLLNGHVILEGQEDRLDRAEVVVPWKTIKLSTEFESNLDKTPNLSNITSLSGSTGGLTPAPIEGLYETTPLGRLPVVDKARNMTAFSAYKRPFPFYKTDKPIIMLGIQDMGLSSVATESAIRTMPPDVSFVFSPYASDMDLWVAEARNRGHEVWLSLPVEPIGYPAADPGPHTLLKGVPERDNLQKLRWLLGRADGYVGFVGGHDSHLGASLREYRPLLLKIFQRGLGFVDSSQNPSPIPQSMALSMKTGYGSVDQVIDASSSPETIDNILIELERTAERKGYAVGLIHPVPLTYQKALAWMQGLKDKGFVLAPLSAATAFADDGAPRGR